jgi:RHS repeat-associated protein
LKRIGANSLAVDNLFYDYSGNQLTRVEDTDDQNAGFKDVTSSVGTKEYLYDFNGNMVKDLNKDITDIEYNYLNLPEVVTLDNGTTITYEYDAAGVKHHKIVDDGTPDTTQYIGPYHFTNSDLKFIQHAEGRALKTGSGYQYEYNLSDHLGNVRVTVDEDGNVIQRQDYYPFGGTFNSSATSPENLYKYNGKEEQKETGWYDYQARFYDPMLGRFLNVDPAADLMRRHSTYAYAFNNPIRFTDPDGMMPITTQQLADAQTYARGMMASAATDDFDAENFQTDGYGELSHSQRSEVGDAGRYHKSSDAAIAALFKIPSKKESGDPSYDQSSGGTANISNVAEAGIYALLGYENLNVVGGALDKLRNSPATAALDAGLVARAKADPKFGSAAFSFRFSQGVEYGGKRAPGNMTDQLLGFWKSEYRATWGVAANEITWLVRHVNVSGWVQVNAAGGITIQHNLSDVFDLRPSPGSRSASYNFVTGWTGWGWHDVLGASEPRVNASWRSGH